MFFRASKRNMLRKINEFKQYYIRTQERVNLAHDDVVDCGKGVWIQEIETVPLWSFHSCYIFSTKYWNNKVFL